MGERAVAQGALFYEFSLERHVSSSNLVRAIDRFVDLSGIRAHLRPFYSEMGRPSVDPELIIRRVSTVQGQVRTSSLLGHRTTILRIPCVIARSRPSWICSPM